MQNFVKKEINKSTDLLSAQYYSQFQYIKNKQLYLIKNIDYKISSISSPKEYYSRPSILSTFNFNTNTEKKLKIQYPFDFQKNYYGFNDIISLSLSNNNLLMGFSGFPGFVSVNLINKTKETYKFDKNLLQDLSINHMDFSKAKSFETQMRNRILGASFGNITESDKYIFISAVGEMPLKGKKDFMANQKLKKIYLFIVDKKRKEVTKLMLKNQMGINGLFTYKNELYSLISLKSDNKLGFIKFTILKK